MFQMDVFGCGLVSNRKAVCRMSECGQRASRSLRHGDRIVVTHSISGDLAGRQCDKTEARSTMTGPAVSGVVAVVRCRVLRGGGGERALRIH